MWILTGIESSFEWDITWLFLERKIFKLIKGGANDVIGGLRHRPEVNLKEVTWRKSKAGITSSWNIVRIVTEWRFTDTAYRNGLICNIVVKWRNVELEYHDIVLEWKLGFHDIEWILSPIWLHIPEMITRQGRNTGYFDTVSLILLNLNTYPMNKLANQFK